MKIYQKQSLVGYKFTFNHITKFSCIFFSQEGTKGSSLALFASCLISAHWEEAAPSQRCPAPALTRTVALFISVSITLDFQALPYQLDPGLNAKVKVVLSTRPTCRNSHCDLCGGFPDITVLA